MFQIRPFETRTVSWWFQNRDRIDMEPVYQRKGKLWSKRQKAYLIDSILNDFDMPKIYIADFTYRDSELNTKKRAYAIIDGKQRLEAIFDFTEGRLALLPGFIYAERPELPLAGLTLSELREKYPEVASKFENFNVSVMSVITDDEAKINDLFIRLNTSKPLSGAEIRNAMRGQLPRIFRDLASHRLFQEWVTFNIARGQDRNAVAKMLLIEFRGDFASTKRVDLDRFVVEGQLTQTYDIDGAARRLSAGLDLMTKIFVPKDPLLRSQGAIPLYYWLVRTYSRTHESAIRDFLLDFESARRQNRSLARLAPHEADQELLFYDALNRSTDDQSSYEARFRILAVRLSQFSKRIVLA